MDFFQYKNNQLMAENLPVKQLAEQFGTPLYVYSRATLERHWHAFNNAFGEHPHLVCFAVKSNPNIAILNVMAKLGSGFDIVSQGELERVLAAGRWRRQGGLFRRRKISPRNRPRIRSQHSLF